MTKGGSGKSKTLGRLIFGDKRKQHVSPSRHRSSTRNGDSTTDLPTSSVVAANKNTINIHDWAVWRMQLNEHMGGGTSDRRSELKQMRQFLQSNPFYQQNSRDPSSGRYNGVRLLFSIPRAKIQPELLDGSRGDISKSNTTEVGDTTLYEQKKIRSTSEDRTASAASPSALQPTTTIDKTISQLFPKGLVGNTGGFLQINEQMVAADGIRPRRTGRNSFRASDRIHSTLQKAVKDGNVLEKIKAFEMQAAAAQAESALKLSSMNHRMQTVASSIQAAAHRTLSPAIVHPIQHPISPTPIQQQQQQPIRPNMGRYVHPVQQRRDAIHGPVIGHESRKGAHVLEPAHGDIILRRRTPSQKTHNDEDYSITAISSMAMTTSQGHHHRNHHHHHHQPRTSVSRSRHRQEMVYDKRATSTNENISHKDQQKQKRTTTPSAKSTTRRRWLKGRKETPTETPVQSDKQEIPSNKSNKTSKNKKKNAEQEKIDSKKVSTSTKKGKLSSDNSRVYGVPNTDRSEQTKIESSSLQPPPIASKIDEEGESDQEKDNNDNTNTYMSPKEIDFSHSKECETVITKIVQRRPSKKHHQQRLSSTDGDILNKVDENIRFSRSNDDHIYRPEFNNEDDRSDGDVFIEDSPIKTTPNITRHQSVVNLSNNEARRLKQQSSNPIRRHASQCTAEELIPNNRRYQRSKENPELMNTHFLKKKQSPITLITRKNKINQDEHIVYEAPHSEQVQAPVCNTHTLKKNRPFHTITAIGSNSANGQTNNKQISKQILHAIMNSMNNNQEQLTISPRPASSSVNDEFFENGPLTNPEETIANITVST